MSEYVMEYDGWAEGIPIGEYLKVRDAMHARKREQVVRCRYCESYREHVNGCVEFGRMEYEEYAIVEPDGFCAWGKRKEA